MSVFRHRGRELQEADIGVVRELIASRPKASRRALSLELCEQWDWRQPNGVPCDALARGLLLALHRASHIELPPPRYVRSTPASHRKKPPVVSIDATPIRSSLSELLPLTFRQVRRTSEEPLFNSLLETHHYLGYTQPVGAHLKYMVSSQGRPLACLSWASAPRHLGPRDRFIGWSKEARRENIRFLAYNPRFLILPWVEVRYLASHILGRMARMLPSEWQRAYGHPVFYLESFTDPARFRGTCYRAANWEFLGRTTGRGNNAPTKKPRVPVKEILGYPLTRRFRELLSCVR